VIGQFIGLCIVMSLCFPGVVIAIGIIHATDRLGIFLSIAISLFFVLAYVVLLGNILNNWVWLNGLFI